MVGSTQVTRTRTSIEGGVRLIVQALENGDFSESIDLANIITSEKSTGSTQLYSRTLVKAIINVMRMAAACSPMVSLHFGYVYGIGGCDVPADFAMAMQGYKHVLAFSDVTAATRANAINNFAGLLMITNTNAIRMICIYKSTCSYH